MACNVGEARRVLVRVKRRRDASPVEALVVKASAKKQKTTDSSSDDQSVNNAVFTFVGTSSPTTIGLDDGRHLVEPHILDKIGSVDRKVKQGSHDKRTPLKKTCHKQDTKSKRDESARRAAAADKRFTLIQSKRNVSLVTSASAKENECPEDDKTCDVFTLGQVDTKGSGDETVICNGVPGKEDFVYDIYCLKDQPTPKSGGSDTFSFSDQDWKDVKTYFDELEDEDGSSADPQSDSEDSNAEEHWRNDYPDELSDDDDDAIYSGTVQRGMRDVYNDEVVSVDTDSDPEGHEDNMEGLCYTRDEAEERLANRHGPAYARFKSKIMRDFANMGLDEKKEEESSENSDDDIDEDDRIALEDGLDY